MRRLKPLGSCCHEIVQEDAHGVHAETLRPAELDIYPLWVEGGGLPHLELVDGVGGDVVAAKTQGCAAYQD